MPRVAGERDFADRRVTHSRLRFVFLNVVREEVPQVLTALFDVLATYRTAAAAVAAAQMHEYWLEEDGLRNAEGMRQQWEARRASVGPEPFTDGKLTAFSAVVDLRTNLLEWGARFDLTDLTGKRNRWVLETALETLSMWHGHGYLVPRLQWWHPSVAGSYPLSDAERQFAGLPLSPGARPTLQEALEVPEEERRSGVPDLLQETRAQAERRLMALGIPREQIREELARLSVALDARGTVPTEQKRDPDRAGATRHFEWLALYICRGMTQEEIGRQGHGQTQQAVSRAILSTAEHTGLELPPERMDLLLRFTRRRPK